VQHGTGAPSSGAGTTGAASAEIAQVRPTIRNNILTARFMGVSPSMGPLGAATLWHGLYKVVSSTYGDFEIDGPLDGLQKCLRENCGFAFALIFQSHTKEGGENPKVLSYLQTGN
jgi:hypothetical protein